MVAYRDRTDAFLTRVSPLSRDVDVSFTFLKGLYRQMGPMRFHIFMQLLLWFGLIPIKMILRWTVNLKYIIGIPEWFFNV